MPFTSRDPVAAQADLRMAGCPSLLSSASASLRPLTTSDEDVIGGPSRSGTTPLATGEEDRSTVLDQQTPDLLTQRACTLLDTSLAHLRTALQATTTTADYERLERGIELTMEALRTLTIDEGH